MVLLHNTQHSLEIDNNTQIQYKNSTLLVKKHNIKAGMNNIIITKSYVVAANLHSHFTESCINRSLALRMSEMKSAR